MKTGDIITDTMKKKFEFVDLILAFIFGIIIMFIVIANLFL